MNGLCLVSAFIGYFPSLNKAMHFSMNMSLAIMIKATDLSAVGTIHLSSFPRLCRDFLFSLVILENVAVWV